MDLSLAQSTLQPRQDNVITSLYATREYRAIALRLIDAVIQPSARIGSLQLCFEFFNRHGTVFKNHIRAVKDQIELLTRQTKVEVLDDYCPFLDTNCDQNVDSHLARTDKTFQRYPRETVVHKPLVNTLFYVLFYHPNDPVERVGSPVAFKKTFKVRIKSVKCV